MRVTLASFRRLAGALPALLLAVASAIHVSAVQAQTFSSIPAIAFDAGGPVIQAHAEPSKPFTVAGERGVLLGQQDGSFEAWVLPVKLLSQLTLEANVEGYNVPIDVNQQAAEVEVRADRTVITYSHAAFTVRQIMFSPNDAVAGAGSASTGPVVLFEFDCLHPTDFVFRFTPELRWMWPERNEGVPDAEWIPRKTGSNGKSEGGFYVLGADYPDLAGALTIPGGEPGVMAPYQERPQVHAVELKLHIDPVRDHGRLFPLLMAVGTNVTAANTKELGDTLAALNAGIAASYAAHAESYKKLLADSTSIETPDKSLDAAFQWAMISIEQLKTKAQPPQRQGPVAGDPVQGTGETALVAGYYASADSARPGFGWFFGRDALYTLYAVNGYGDFALSKDELAFLIKRQRADGKIMHEYSQTAGNVDWQAFPYMYAAADATPLFLLAVEDYVKASGDTAFLAANRDAVEKAWAFETDPAHDTDHDGIYDNSQGTGWVESWPGGMPHQEIYLALLDQQASGAMAHLEKLLGSGDKSAAAQQRADTIAATIEREYYDPAKSCYAFSHNLDGSQDQTSTVYPAMAWWTDLAGAKPVLAHPEGCLEQLAAHTLATDWGLRDVSSDEKIYDGMSYHQGSVWPLFTGWAALAEYRGGQPLAGYQLLKENANLTWAEDLGADTELLSGDFYVPFGRSTSHQLWSSAMVITPTLRGLFGISVDALTKTITVNPHLPPSWDHADVLNLAVAGGGLSLTFNKEKGYLQVMLGGDAVAGWRIRSDVSGAHSEPNSRIPMMRVPVPQLQIDASYEIPEAGSRTEHARVLHEDWQANHGTVVFEGLAGSRGEFDLVGIDAAPNLKLDSPENRGISPSDLTNLAAYALPCKLPCRSTPLELKFPPGEGWKTLTVTLSW